MAHNSKTVGIYSITSPSNKMYIGQSTNTEKRMQQHRSMLRSGTHTNKRLQGACNKYGLDKLIFKVVEVCNKDRLNDREQWWIDNCNTQYNMSRSAENCMKDPLVAARVLATNTRVGNLQATSVRTKKMWENSEYRQRILAVLLKARTDPKTHAAIRSARNTPEAKKQASEHAKKLWDTKEHRDKMTVANKNKDPLVLEKVGLLIKQRHALARADRILAQGISTHSQDQLKALRSELRRAKEEKTERYKVVVIALNALNRSNTWA